jgi:hypothetical protein
LARVERQEQLVGSSGIRLPGRTYDQPLAELEGPVEAFPLLDPGAAIDHLHRQRGLSTSPCPEIVEDASYFS